MSKLSATVSAKLTVEVTCPLCGGATHIHLLSSEGARRQVCCNACHKPFQIQINLDEMNTQGPLRLLEMAMIRWLRDICPLSEGLANAAIDVRAINAAAPAPPAQKAPPQPPAHEPKHETMSASNPLGKPLEKPARDKMRDSLAMTQYTRGTATGIAEIEKILKTDPSNRQVREWLAFAYYRNNHYESAVNTYLELIEGDPTDADSHYYLANAYYKLGHRDNAVKNWEKVISLVPTSPKAKRARDRIAKVQ